MTPRRVGQLLRLRAADFLPSYRQSVGWLISLLTREHEVDGEALLLLTRADIDDLRGAMYRGRRIPVGARMRLWILVERVQDYTRVFAKRKQPMLPPGLRDEFVVDGR